MIKSAVEIMKKFWKLFASIKLAVILILLMTGLSLFGTFAAPVRFFHTWWFLAPGVLLMINILVCSINRWRGIRQIIAGGPIRQPDPFFAGAGEQPHVLDLPTEVDVLAEKLAERLKRLGYRVRSERVERVHHLAADKNRLFKLGTFISHFSLILFVLAYLIGSTLGFRDTSFIVAEGEVRSIGHGTNLSLEVRSFTDEYYPDRTPKDYRSEVILYRNGQAVRQAAVRVNHPLIFEGTRIYQSFFGPAIQILLQQSGQPDTTHSVPLSSRSSSQGYQRSSGVLPLTDSSITLRFTRSASNASDPMIPAGQIAVELYQNNRQIGMKLMEKGRSIQISGISITHLEDLQYSGFQVSRDPGNALVWIASVLFVLGTIAVLFFVHLQLWIRITPLTSHQSRIVIRLIAPRGFSRASETARLLEAIKKAAGQG